MADYTVVGTQHPICTLGYVASESSASDTRPHSTRSGTAPASEPFLQKLVEKGELRGELLANPGCACSRGEDCGPPCLVGLKWYGHEEIRA